jgi:hypothetical protein
MRWSGSHEALRLKPLSAASHKRIAAHFDCCIARCAFYAREVGPLSLSCAVVLALSNDCVTLKIPGDLVSETLLWASEAPWSVSAGWNGIESWKCASKGCCYDDKGPFTVGTDDTKVTQPVCFYPNGAQSNYDLQGSFAAAGGLPSQLPSRILAITCTAFPRLGVPCMSCPEAYPQIQVIRNHTYGWSSS